MTYNVTGKRIRTENLAGQVTTTAWDGWSVTYNGENCPVLWENVSTNSHTPNSSTPPLISMSYDRMGRRVTKNDQRFVYDGYLQIADNAGSAYIWDCTDNIATRPLVWNYLTFQPFNVSTSYYSHDGNKNVSEIVASSGEISAHYEYEPFGAVLVAYGESVAANPWCFSCEFYDYESATMYYNYRQYNYGEGRWLSYDPLRGGMVYCNNNPINLRDTLGLVPVSFKTKDLEGKTHDVETVEDVFIDDKTKTIVNLHG